MKGKSGAIEMSVGTIVVIVLSMSMLILGMVLVKNIFGGATNIVDLNNDQILKEIEKIYGDDKKLVIYPNVDIFEVKLGKEDAFAIRIKNLLDGVDANTAKFSYTITPSDFEDCGFTEAQILGWMKGESEAGIGIAPGESAIGKVLIEVPKGTSLCKFKIRVSVQQDGAAYNYANEDMFISIKG